MPLNLAIIISCLLIYSFFVFLAEEPEKKKESKIKESSKIAVEAS